MTAQQPKPTAWWELEFWRIQNEPKTLSAFVDDVHLAQPVGFVWFRKPRYRVKAVSRRQSSEVK